MLAVKFVHNGNQDLDSFIGAMSKAIRSSSNSQDKVIYSKRTLELALRLTDDPAIITKLTRQVSKLLYETVPDVPGLFEYQPSSGFPIHIVVSSIDLYNHPVSDFCLPLLKDLAAERVGGVPKYKLSFLSFSTFEDDVTEEYKAIASSTGGEFNTYDFTSRDNVDLFQSFMDKNVSGFLDLSGYTDPKCLLLDVMACS